MISVCHCVNNEVLLVLWLVAEHLLAVHGTCVSDCSEGYFEDSNGKCAKCDGLCPKSKSIWFM